MQILFIIFFFVVIGYYLSFVHGKPSVAEQEEDKDLRSKYNFDVKPTDEKPVKIERLVIYPCRGV